MGFRPSAEELAELIEEIDEDGSGAIEFPEFAQEHINQSNPKYIPCMQNNVIQIFINVFLRCFMLLYRYKLTFF